MGDSTIDNAKNYFTLHLRNAVMSSILRQDREYFDFHQAGVLQERLNHDTWMVSEHLIQHPKNLIVKTFKVLVRLTVMYRLRDMMITIRTLD